MILSVEGLNVFYGRKQVVHDVTFDLAKGEVVALVGESGSGKTTISRAVGGLHKDWTGTIAFEGRELATSARKRSAEDRRRIQYIFQNPYLSLNPRLTIEQIIKRPMELFGLAKGKAGHRPRARAAWSRSRSAPGCCTTRPAGSPVVSGSGSRSPGRWPPSRT